MPARWDGARVDRVTDWLGATLTLMDPALPGEGPDALGVGPPRAHAAWSIKTEELRRAGVRREMGRISELTRSAARRRRGRRRTLPGRTRSGPRPIPPRR